MNKDKALFVNQQCFVGTSMRVEGGFRWFQHKQPPVGLVVFENASVKSFLTDKNSFPERGSCYVDGFVYDSFEIENLNEQKNTKSRIDNLHLWLGRRAGSYKSLQPYSQIIKVLSSSGHDVESREIAIERERQRSRHLPRLRRILRDSTLGLFVDYGYKPWKALYFILFFVIFGALFFGAAKTEQIMVHAKSDLSMGYPQFVPLAYSIDVFLPIVDLHQEEYWIPSIEAKPNSWDGILVMNYMWFHIGLGWVLTTIFVSAITGIIRTDADS